MSNKTTSAKYQPRQHTASEMQAAITSVRANLDVSQMPKDSDHPADILETSVQELLTARQIIEEMRAWISQQAAKLSRR